MTPSFEELQRRLKQLPGLGYRSAERLALHLLVEQPHKLLLLVECLQKAANAAKRCDVCGSLTEETLCDICADPNRDNAIVCVVEQVPDLVALERSAAFKGRYHVLHGKLSPINRIGPGELNLDALGSRLASGEIKELILALSNDVEGEATCHYITETLLPESITITRIGFGLPSGGGVFYADPITLKSALESRRSYS